MHMTIGGYCPSKTDILLYNDDTKHLLGTTDAPTPKWEPKPGELVAVSDTGKEDDWEPCQYIGRSDYKDMPYKAWRLTHNARNPLSWTYCEPLRKHFTVPEE